MDRTLKEVIFFCALWIVGAVVVMIGHGVAHDGLFIVGGCLLGVGTGYWLKMLIGERGSQGGR